MERGGLTVLGAGIAMMVLFTGGLAVDLGRAVALRAELAAAADAAVAAGANGIDTVRFREDGQVRLAPAVAEDLALAQLAENDRSGVPRSVEVAADEDVVVMTLSADSPLLLLRLFSGSESWAVRVTASARPTASMPLPSSKEP